MTIDKAILNAGGVEAMAESVGVLPDQVCAWQLQGWIPVRYAEVVSTRFNIPLADLVPEMVRRVVS